MVEIARPEMWLRDGPDSAGASCRTDATRPAIELDKLRTAVTACRTVMRAVAISFDDCLIRSNARVPTMDCGRCSRQSSFHTLCLEKWGSVASPCGQTIMTRLLVSLSLTYLSLLKYYFHPSQSSYNGLLAHISTQVSRRQHSRSHHSCFAVQESTANVAGPDIPKACRGLFPICPDNRYGESSLVTHAGLSFICLYGEPVI